MVEQSRSWDVPEPFTQANTWTGVYAVSPASAAAHLRRLLRRSVQDHYSTAYLVEQINQLVDHLREQQLVFCANDEARRNVRPLVQKLAGRISAEHQRHDVVIPIVNLRLDVSDSSLTIGPVKIVRDDLQRFFIYGDNADELSDFGRWAVEHFELQGPDESKVWSAHLGSVASHGKVVKLPGDRQGAIEQAKQHIDTALMILCVSNYFYGTWSGQERYGSYGSFFDPIERFDVMGSSRGGLRISLSSRSGGEGSTSSETPSAVDSPVPIEESRPGAMENGPYVYQIGRTDLDQPVLVSDSQIKKRWPVIEQMATVLWAEDKTWHELAVATRRFAEGVEATTAEDAFLKYAIALDVLLGREERGYTESQINRVSERLAFLLGESDPTFRQRLFHAFKPLYGKRSGIVHGTATTNEFQLHRMESIARLAILRMAWEIHHRGHRNINAFIDWVRKLTFGEPFEPIDVPPFLRLSENWLDETQA